MFIYWHCASKLLDIKLGKWVGFFFLCFIKEKILDTNIEREKEFAISLFSQ